MKSDKRAAIICSVNILSETNPYSTQPMSFHVRSDPAVTMEMVCKTSYTFDKINRNGTEWTPMPLVA